MQETLSLIASSRSFGGWQQRYRHRALVLGCEMHFSIYLPPQAEVRRVPVLYWLSGLTCTDENFVQKAGAQRAAAELGIAIVVPDTSPRGEHVPGDSDGSWDFGHGAGFYVNATEAPWNRNYRMHDYVVNELPRLVETAFPVTAARSISGHSMGGHGALVCALRNPGRFRSVSAFSPIANPMACPWGQKAFSRFLGADEHSWRAWDACELIATAKERLPLLVDQGEADNFLIEQLKPETLEAACAQAGHALTMRRQPGYDHSYFFVATFIEDHLAYHAAALASSPLADG